MGKLLLVAGSDKIGRKLIRHIESAECDIKIYLDKSSSVKRVIKLLLKRRIRLKHFIKMLLAELMRSESTIRNYPSISSNRDMLDVIRNESPDIVYFFRAGLIIDRSVINTGVQLLNVHCAKVPEYGGLASIARALDDHLYEQCAAMHRIIENIDEGEVLKTEPYTMQKTNSYRENENIAYDAGIKLIMNEILKTKKV